MSKLVCDQMFQSKLKWLIIFLSIRQLFMYEERGRKAFTFLCRSNVNKVISCFCLQRPELNRKEISLSLLSFPFSPHLPSFLPFSVLPLIQTFIPFLYTAIHFQLRLCDVTKCVWRVCVCQRQYVCVCVCVCSGQTHTHTTTQLKKAPWLGNFISSCAAISIRGEPRSRFLRRFWSHRTRSLS